MSGFDIFVPYMVRRRTLWPRYKPLAGIARKVGGIIQTLWLRLLEICSIFISTSKQARSVPEKVPNVNVCCLALDTE